jgi:Zn-dependent peptidase ImmA (M78 family)
MLLRKVNMRHLLNGLEIEGDRSFHTMDLDEYGGSPEAVARALRTVWRVPSGPISNLTALIESAGGIVLATEFGTQKLFGMSCWAGRDRPFFFLNAAAPTDVLRWTLAHELGHLTMHGTPSEGDPEQQADEFAGEFLAPRLEITSDLRNVPFARLPNLKLYWRISMKALIRRAQQIGAMDALAASRLYRQYSYRRYGSGEPYLMSPEPPTLVQEAIRIHLHEHRYTLDELAEAVLLLSDEFRCELMNELRTNNVENIIQLRRG